MNVCKLIESRLAEAFSVAELDLADIAVEVTVAGPGFLNMTLRKDYLSRFAMDAALNDHLLLSRLLMRCRARGYVLRRSNGYTD